MNMNTYWHERFTRTGLSFKGAGHSGWTESENILSHLEAWDMVKKALGPEKKSIIEIGVGNGFYTKMLLANGSKFVYGMDICPVLFPLIRAMVIDTRDRDRCVLTEHDITSDNDKLIFSDALPTPEAAIMIDVEQHIMDDEAVIRAFNKIDGWVPDGRIVFTCHCSPKRTVMNDHEVARPLAFYQTILSDRLGRHLSDPIPFRGKFLLTAG